MSSGFTDGAVRVGVRSYYEDWSAGNELFTAYLEHVGAGGGRTIEVVEIGEAEAIPEDLALLADFAALQIPLGWAEPPPDCLPTLSRSYSPQHLSSFELLMPALTAESEGALWAQYLQRAIPDLQTVGVLVIDVESGEALFDAFVAALDPDVDIVSRRHHRASIDVAAEVHELLDAAPDAFVGMTFGEPCRLATLAVAEREEELPAALFMPSSCATVSGPFPRDWALDGWMALRAPTLDRDHLDPGLVAALDREGWSNFPDESASVLAAWWVIDALDRGSRNRVELIEALLTVDGGPPWLASDVRFATRGIDDPLAIEGASLQRHVDGRWRVLDILELDSGDP